MRPIQAFECSDGSVHLTPDAAAKHDFRIALNGFLAPEEGPKIELADAAVDFIVNNMHALERMMGEAKKRDTTAQITTDPVIPEVRKAA